MSESAKSMLLKHFQEKVGEEVVIKKDIRVSRVNVRTAKGNIPKNDKVISVDFKVKILEVGMSAEMVTHGTAVAYITDGSLFYWVPLEDLYGYIQVLAYRFFLNDEGKVTVVYSETDTIESEFETKYEIESDEFLKECEQIAFELRE